jgi:cytochrome c-type biogenesis protein
MTLAVAFFGGLVSCLSPCVLPVIPVFVGYVAGARDAAPLVVAGTNPATAAGKYRAAGFLLGFAGIFVAIWVSIGLVGFALLQAVPDLRVAAGLAIAALGLAMIVGWQPHFAAGRWGGAAGSFGGSFLLGAGVAIGWTPCIGPTLGAILTLAAASDTVWSGAALLVAYALGMSLPFIALGLGVSRFEPLSRALRPHGRAIQVASGGMIVAVGALVATNAFARLAGLVRWAF